VVGYKKYSNVEDVCMSRPLSVRTKVAEAFGNLTQADAERYCSLVTTAPLLVSDGTYVVDVAVVALSLSPRPVMASVTLNVYAVLYAKSCSAAEGVDVHSPSTVEPLAESVTRYLARLVAVPIEAVGTSHVRCAAR
jgi:hypothetical protein